MRLDAWLIFAHVKDSFSSFILARVPVDNAVDDLAGWDVDARHGVHVVHGDGAVVVDDKAAPLPAR